MEQRGETPERLEKELTRSEITRLVEHYLAMADPAMLQQALILESEANAREEEKAPLSNRKVDNGELSQALSRSQTITGRASESMVQQALDRRSLRGRFVDGGEVRDCLSHAGWSQNHIDFLFYRSQHEHVKE